MLFEKLNKGSNNWNIFLFKEGFLAQLKQCWAYNLLYISFGRVMLLQ